MQMVLCHFKQSKRTLQFLFFFLLLQPLFYYCHTVYLLFIKIPWHIIIIFIKTQLSFSSTLFENYIKMGVSQAPPGFLIPAVKLGNFLNTLNWVFQVLTVFIHLQGSRILYLLSNERWFASCCFVFVYSSGRVNPSLLLSFDHLK